MPRPPRSHDRWSHHAVLEARDWLRAACRNGPPPPTLGDEAADILRALRVANFVGGRCSAPAAARLTTDLRAVLASTILRQGADTALNDALRATGAPFAYVKGAAALRTWAHGTPALRFAADTDVLAAASDLAACKVALDALGYAPESSARLAEAHFAQTYLKPVAGGELHVVDLHVSLGPFRATRQLARAVLDAAGPHNIAPPEFNCLIAAVHRMRGAWSGDCRELVDVAHWMESTSTAELLALARKYELGPALFALATQTHIWTGSRHAASIADRAARRLGAIRRALLRRAVTLNAVAWPSKSRLSSPARSVVAPALAGVPSADIVRVALEKGRARLADWGGHAP